MNEIQRRRRALMARAAAAPAPVHGTWEDLFARIADGTYATAYQVGEILPLDLGTEGAVNAQIAGFNVDTKSDDSGYAKVTFITQYALNTSRRFNPQLSPSSAPYTEGTGAIGGWGKSEIRAYLASTIKPLFPSAISSRIVAVKKYSRIFNTSGSASNNNLTSDELWLPSARETGSAVESVGVERYSLFASGTSATTTKVKTKPGGTADIWLTRTANGAAKVDAWTSTGASSGPTTQTGRLIVVGFCID